MPKILLKFKESILNDILLEKEIVTIGRNPNNDIHIDNLAVSNFHAKIVKQGNQFIIEDLKSTNGTFVNEQKIVKTSLNNNDIITIGKHTLIFLLPETEDEDKTVQIKKPQQDKTMVLDTKAHKEILRAVGAGLPASKKEPVGGFTVIYGSTDKPEYELTSRLTTIGKTDAAGIRLKGFFAPKIAAYVNKTADGYFVVPSSSGKKTLLNGKALTDRTELKDGDILEVGQVKMQFFLKE
jgi:pSer/pThr/pTyr-binding forkhead associated (FHA) protein